MWCLSVCTARVPSCRYIESLIKARKEQTPVYQQPKLGHHRLRSEQLESILCTHGSDTPHPATSLSATALDVMTVCVPILRVPILEDGGTWLARADTASVYHRL